MNKHKHLQEVVDDVTYKINSTDDKTDGGGLAQLVASLIASTKLINTRSG